MPARQTRPLNRKQLELRDLLDSVFIKDGKLNKLYDKAFDEFCPIVTENDDWVMRGMSEDEIDAYECCTLKHMVFDYIIQHPRTTGFWKDLNDLPTVMAENFDLDEIVLWLAEQGISMKKSVVRQTAKRMLGARRTVESLIQEEDIEFTMPVDITVHGDGSSLWMDNSRGTYHITKLKFEIDLSEDYGERKGCYLGNLTVTGTKKGGRQFEIEYTDDQIEREMFRAVKKCYPGLVRLEWSEHGMQPEHGWNFDITVVLDKATARQTAKGILSQEEAYATAT